MIRRGHPRSRSPRRGRGNDLSAIGEREFPDGRSSTTDVRAVNFVTEVRDDVITGKAESRLSRLAHYFHKVGCPRTCNFLQGASLWSCYCTPPHRASYIQGPRVIHFKMQRVAVAILFVLGLHAASAGLLTPVVGLLTPPSTPSTPSTPTMGTGSGAADPQVVDFSGRHFEFIGELACIFHTDEMAMCVESHASRPPPSMLLPSMLPASLSTAAEGGPELGINAREVGG